MALTFPSPVGILQGAVCAVAVAERLVEQHQVDVVGAQAAQALLNRRLCLVVAVV